MSQLLDSALLLGVDASPEEVLHSLTQKLTQRHNDEITVEVPFFANKTGWAVRGANGNNKTVGGVDVFYAFSDTLLCWPMETNFGLENNTPMRIGANDVERNAARRKLLQAKVWHFECFPT
jgi:hypothetical protein